VSNYSHEAAREEKEECIATKDAEIARLQEELEVLRGATLPSTRLHTE